MTPAAPLVLSDEDRALMEKLCSEWRLNDSDDCPDLHEYVAIHFKRAGYARGLEDAAKMVERKLFLYANVAECVAAIRALGDE